MVWLFFLFLDVKISTPWLFEDVKLLDDKIPMLKKNFKHFMPTASPEWLAQANEQQVKPVLWTETILEGLDWLHIPDFVYVLWWLYVETRLTIQRWIVKN